MAFVLPAFTGDFWKEAVGNATPFQTAFEPFIQGVKDMALANWDMAVAVTGPATKAFALSMGIRSADYAMGAATLRGGIENGLPMAMKIGLSVATLGADLMQAAPEYAQRITRTVGQFPVLAVGST
jgi:hypothetical protein